MLARAGSAAFWAFIAVTSALLYPVAVLLWLVTAPFDRHRRLLHRFTCAWASLYTRVNPLWLVEVRGRERIRRGETYVMVANHASLLDILVLFRLSTHFTWVSKAENFRVPFIGWNMRLNGYVPLRRGDRASVAAMMAACERSLRDGESVMLFPEGTRSRDGGLGAFRTGAFELAQRTGRPVLPVAVSGTADALPRRGFVLRGRHRITVEVLEPVPPSSWEGLSARGLAERTRDVLAASLRSRAAEGSVERGADAGV